VPFRG